MITIHNRIPHLCRTDFYLNQFIKLTIRYKHIGYNVNVMRQSACLVVKPVTDNNFASLFNNMPLVMFQTQ